MPAVRIRRRLRLERRERGSKPPSGRALHGATTSPLAFNLHTRAVEGATARITPRSPTDALDLLREPYHPLARLARRQLLYTPSRSLFDSVVLAGMSELVNQMLEPIPRLPFLPDTSPHIGPQP